ncbi:PilW family protein [Marinicellulosiphila megalodicopiae]|uniref:PilW family protein n=1 Tax=Marinicellulosiphila megalodicopiae TaxID=2724896 RepID=UPI003BB04252
MKINNHQGLSLVELIISLVIASVVLIGVIQLSIASQSNYHFQEQISVMQENARFALHELSKNIKNSHYLPAGCSKYTSIANITWSKSTNQPAVIDSGLGVKVIEISDKQLFDYSKLEKATLNNDALYLGLIDSNQSFEVESYNAEFNQFNLTSFYSISKHILMLWVNDMCSQITVFSALQKNNSNPENNTTINSIVLDMSGENIELIKNCSDYLYGDYFCKTKNGNVINGYKSNKNNVINSKIYPVFQKYYFVSDSTQKDKSGISYPALYLNENELVQGVESMNISIGIDTDFDGLLDRYVKSNELKDNDWNNAKSLKVELTLRSLERIEGIKTENDDGYLRRIYVQTIGLRNEW